MGANLKEIHPAAHDFRETSLTGIAALALQACGVNPTGMSADRLMPPIRRVIFRYCCKKAAIGR